MFTTMGYFEKTMKPIVEYIEQALGGTVSFFDNKELKSIVLAWKKNPGTISALRFKKAYSYEEFEKLLDPNIIGMNFVEAYTNPDKPRAKKGKGPKVVVPEASEESQESNSEVNPGDSG